MNVADAMATRGTRQGLRERLEKELRGYGVELTTAEWERVEAVIAEVRTLVKQGDGVLNADRRLFGAPLKLRTTGLDAVEAVLRDILQAKGVC